MKIIGFVGLPTHTHTEIVSLPVNTYSSSVHQHDSNVNSHIIKGLRITHTPHIYTHTQNWFLRLLMKKIESNCVEVLFGSQKMEYEMNYNQLQNKVLGLN